MPENHVLYFVWPKPLPPNTLVHFVERCFCREATEVHFQRVMHAHANFGGNHSHSYLKGGCVLGGDGVYLVAAVFTW